MFKIKLKIKISYRTVTPWRYFFHIIYGNDVGFHFLPLFWNPSNFDHTGFHLDPRPLEQGTLYFLCWLKQYLLKGYGNTMFAKVDIPWKPVIYLWYTCHKNFLFLGDCDSFKVLNISVPSCWNFDVE